MNVASWAPRVFLSRTAGLDRTKISAPIYNYQLCPKPDLP